MNDHRNLREESGQVLMLIALGLVALLGLTALAVDGGMIYADRRFDQNAADASSYAGAGAAAMAMENSQISYRNFTCSAPAGSVMANKMNLVKSEASQAAQLQAASNQFSIDNHLTNQHGVEVTCGIDKPIGSSIADKYIDVKVMVTTTIQTAFAHMFYKGEIRNTVTAVARARPRSDIAFGHAIVNLSEDCKDDLEFNGNTNVIVHNGGIFSNGCMTRNGGVNVKVSPASAGITFVDKCSKCESNMEPTPQKAPSKLPTMTVNEPDCNHPSLTEGGKVSKGGVLEPGRYSEIKNTGNSQLVLKPGLYCLDGDFSVQGGDVSGTDVTIYMRDGALTINGNGQVRLSAPTGETSPAIRGMLILMPESNQNNHKLEGGSASWYVGAIYSPKGEINIGGNSSINPTFTTQIIAYKVKLHGTSDVEIYYDDLLTFQQPAYLESYR
jgi:Flp pilus assembly protein TadG